MKLVPMSLELGDYRINTDGLIQHTYFTTKPSAAGNCQGLCCRKGGQYLDVIAHNAINDNVVFQGEFSDFLSFVSLIDATLIREL